jgi:general secretion pathway protein I
VSIGSPVSLALDRIAENIMSKSIFRPKCLRFTCRSSRRDGGFTLVEVIVAVAILALSAGAIFPVMSDSIRNTHRADALADASTLAQSLLAKVGNEIPLQEGELRGQAGKGLQWRLQMLRYGDAADRKRWPVAAYTVVAEVSWNPGSTSQPIELRTLRLGPKGESP